MTALFSRLVSWYSTEPPGLTTYVLKAPIDGLTPHVLLQEQPHQQQASRPLFCTDGVRASYWRARWIWEGCLAKSRPASRCPDDVMTRFGGGRMGCRKLASLFYPATIVRWFRSGVSVEAHRPEVGDIVANRLVVRAASPSYRSCATLRIYSSSNMRFGG